MATVLRSVRESTVDVAVPTRDINGHERTSTSGWAEHVTSVERNPVRRRRLVPAYVIADVDINDPDGFEVYRDRVAEVLARHGVEPVVFGGSTEVLEGDWSPTRLVILRFKDVEHARAWYFSDEYKELTRIRQATSKTNMLILEGFEP